MKSLGLILLGVPVCVFVGKTLEIEWVMWVMAVGLWLICMAPIFKEDKE